MRFSYQRFVVLFLLSGLLAVPAASAMASAPAQAPADPLEDRIDEAIERGLEYLRRTQSSNGSWRYGHTFNHRLGITCLCGLALLENGVPRDDPAIQAALPVVLELAEGSNQTYDLSLAILFLSRVGAGLENEYSALIQRLGRRLEVGEREGQWSYTVPLEPPETTGSEARSIGESAARFDRRPGDNSNTQFALLGVWAAGRLGFDSNRALEALERHFRTTINPDGGWGYRPRNGSRPGLTCAGLLALAIGASRPEQAERLSSRARGQRLAQDPVFQEALAAVTRVAKRLGPHSKIYDLWSLERVCVALGLRELDGVDWHRVGAELLLERQRADGAWPHGDWGSLPETCLALLFLRKSNLAFELDRVLRLPGAEPAASQLAGSGGDGPSEPPPEPQATTGDDGVRVTLQPVDDRDFPRIALYFEVETADGTPLLDATKEDFRVTEYGEERPILEFTAPVSVEVIPTTVVLVVDRSTSMAEENRIGALKQAVNTFLDVMPDGSTVAVVAFSSEVSLLRSFTTETDTVREAIAPLFPDGATRFYDAVAEALRLLEDEPGRRAIVALTDGEDTFSQFESLVSVVEKARGARLPVYTVGLGTEREIASGDLKRLAAETQAQYFAAREADQLRSIYEEIATKLGQTYKIVYETNRDIPDGTLRPVKIFYRASTEAAGEGEVFIRGMVVPSFGWARLFLALAGGLAVLAWAPRALGARPRAGGADSTS